MDVEDHQVCRADDDLAGLGNIKKAGEKSKELESCTVCSSAMRFIIFSACNSFTYLNLSTDEASLAADVGQRVGAD